MLQLTAKDTNNLDLLLQAVEEQQEEDFERESDKVRSLREVIMERDGLTEEEADDLIEEAREMVQNGTDPEEVLESEFGLEPDYLFDLL